MAGILGRPPSTPHHCRPWLLRHCESCFGWFGERIANQGFLNWHPHRSSCPSISHGVTHCASRNHFSSLVIVFPGFRGEDCPKLVGVQLVSLPSSLLDLEGWHGWIDSVTLELSETRKKREQRSDAERMKLRSILSLRLQDKVDIWDNRRDLHRACTSVPACSQQSLDLHQNLANANHVLRRHPSLHWNSPILEQGILHKQIIWMFLCHDSCGCFTCKLCLFLWFRPPGPMMHSPWYIFLATPSAVGPEHCSWPPQVQARFLE